MEKESAKKVVREAYGKMARERGRQGGCGCSSGMLSSDCSINRRKTGR